MTRPSPALTLIALLTACDGGVEGAADGLAGGGSPRVDALAATVADLGAADATRHHDRREAGQAPRRGARRGRHRVHSTPGVRS